MRPLRPGQVVRRRKLFVVKEKRVSGVGITDVCPVGDLKRGFSALQPVGPVGSGNVEYVRPVIHVEVKLGAQMLERVTENAVVNNIRTNRVGTADAKYINLTGSRS